MSITSKDKFSSASVSLVSTIFPVPAVFLISEVAGLPFKFSHRVGQGN